MAREMKDSGIEWIGEIPAEWSVERGKNILQILERPVKEDDGIITCFRDGEVTLRCKRREEGFTMSDKEFGYQGIEVGDLVVHGMDGFAGAIGVSDSRGKATPVLNVMDSSQEKRFLMYYLRCAAHCGLFLSLSTGIRVRSCDTNWNKLKNILYILPSIEEQQRIVSFIDDGCARIDSVIAQTRASIEEYKKLKQAVITQAVTKGIRPDRQMKDSGVEWIGDVPIDWQILSLGTVTEAMRNGYVGPTKDLFFDEGVRYIQSLHIKEGRIDFSRHEYYVSEEWAKEHPKIKENDVLIVQTGDIGSVGLVTGEYDGCNCHALIIATPKINLVYPEYLTYYLRSVVGRELLLYYKTGALLPHLNSGKIKFASVCVPSMEEQKEIADYLNVEVSRIDSLLEKKESIIADLESYKKSLIYEYVTGKKEVPA